MKDDRFNNNNLLDEKTKAKLIKQISGKKENLRTTSLFEW
jgi:hypothetical protein